jgi:hypothetical protein
MQLSMHSLGHVVAVMFCLIIRMRISINPCGNFVCIFFENRSSEKLG